MVLGLIVIFASALTTSHLLFLYYNHRNKHQHRSNEPDPLFLLASFLVVTVESFLAFLDRLFNSFIQLICEVYSSDTPFYQSWQSSDLKYDDESIRLEANKLANTIVAVYLDPLQRKIQPNKDEDVLLFQFEEAFGKAIFKLYKVLSTKTDWNSFLSKLCEKIEAHVLNHSQSIDPKEQVGRLLELLDEVFILALPDELKTLLTTCDCDHRKNPLQCLQQSSNPSRLFIYNIIIFTVLVPLIRKCVDPLFPFYCLILLLSKVGGVSIQEFVASFGSSDYFPPEQSTIFDVEAEFQDLVHEANEEWSEETSVFSNIRIVSVKTVQSGSSVFKANSYIDYLIEYSVLQCQDGDKKSSIDLRTYQVNRRFSEFLAFQENLETVPSFKKFMNRLEDKPSNILFKTKSLINFIKQSTASEESSMVQVRKQSLEIFLNELAKFKPIGESAAFSNFLGYKHHLVTDVLEVIGQQSQHIRSTKSTSKFEINLKSVKNFFKMFMPVKAKYGQLPSKLEDVFINDQTRNKYSIKQLIPQVDLSYDMPLKYKLNQWIHSNQVSNENCTDSIPETKPTLEISDELIQRLTSCSVVLLCKNASQFHRFLIRKMLIFGKFSLTHRQPDIFAPLATTIIQLINSVIQIAPAECDNEDSISYHDFNCFFKDSDYEKLFTKYSELCEEKICHAEDERIRVAFQYVYRWLFRTSLETLFRQFANPETNCLLLYRVLDVAREEIYNINLC